MDIVNYQAVIGRAPSDSDRNADTGDVLTRGCVDTLADAGGAHERNTITYTERDVIPYSSRDSISYVGGERNAIPCSAGEERGAHERNTITHSSDSISYNMREGSERGVFRREDGRTRRPRRDPQGRRAQRDAADVIIYFANITRWNSRAVDYMAVKDSPMGSAHLVCVAETHLRGPRLTQEIKAMYKAGWRAAVVPSVETPNAQHSGPGHGGVAIFTQKRLHAQPLTSEAKTAIQEDGSKGVLTQWTATELRLQGVDILVLCVYLAPEYGLSGANWSTLSEAADFIHEHGKAFIMVGDFNNTVEELQPTGIERYLGAVWRTPRGQFPGDHRPIDLVLATAALGTRLDIDWDATSPWAQPHTGFTIKLPRSLLTMQMRVLESPLGHQESCGPDLPWDWHLARAEAVLEPGWQRLPAHRWPHLQYSDRVDRQYMLFCLAAESVMASRQCLDFRAAAFHRGWPVQTKVLPVEAPRPQGWKCQPTGLTAWWGLRTRLANYTGVLSKRPSQAPETSAGSTSPAGRSKSFTTHPRLA